LSSTRHNAPNTNQLLTNYSFKTRSLALSLALFFTFLPIFDKATVGSLDSNPVQCKRPSRRLTHGLRGSFGLRIGVGKSS